MNDPVANKMLARVDAMPKLDPPEDKGITTLCALWLAPAWPQRCMGTPHRHLCDMVATAHARMLIRQQGC